MKSSFGVQVGRMGKFLGLERTEVHLLSAMPDACLKRAVPLVECHAKQSKFVVGFSAPLVLLVDGLGNDSQVCQSVVGLDAVNVIDLTARPIAVDVQEDNPVLPKGLPIDGDVSVSVLLCIATKRANSFAAISSNGQASREYSGVRVVVEKFAQTLGGKIVCSHEALLLLIGQRLASVGSALRASLFSAMRPVGAMS